MQTRTYILALTLLVVAIMQTACGGAPTSAPQVDSATQAVPTAVSQSGSTLQANTSSSSNSAPQPTPTSQAGGENAITNGEGGVEAAFITYSDSKQGFAIGHPSPWTQDTSVTAGVKFVGGDSYMALEFVTPPAGTDAMTYAQSDVAAVSAAFTNFKKIDIKASTEVQNAIVFGFTADGKSAITGKTFTAHNERYYMPLVDGRIAILTVDTTENHYDREGIRDIALTFKLLK